MQSLDAISNPGDVRCGVSREDSFEPGRCALRHHSVGHRSDEAGGLSQGHGLAGFWLALNTCAKCEHCHGQSARCSRQRTNTHTHIQRNVMVIRQTQFPLLNHVQALCLMYHREILTFITSAKQTQSTASHRNDVQGCI